MCVVVFFDLALNSNPPTRPSPTLPESLLHISLFINLPIIMCPTHPPPSQINLAVTWTEGANALLKSRSSKAGVPLNPHKGSSRTGSRGPCMWLRLRGRKTARQKNVAEASNKPSVVFFHQNKGLICCGQCGSQREETVGFQGELAAATLWGLWTRPVRCTEVKLTALPGAE